MSLKTYSELIRYSTFLDRYEYLRIGGSVGAETFGHSRYINQAFYTSHLWRSIRNEVIIRDEGCDLGIPDCQINHRVIIHHMNPISEEDIEHQSDLLLDPEFLICVSRDTHNAIHFGDASLLPQLPIERTMNDTSPWLLHSRRN
jgi:hypothetical protein